MMTSSNGNIFSVTGPLCWPVNSHHKGQWCGALMFSLICVWINGWVNHFEAGDLGRHRTHYDVIVTLHIFFKVLFIITAFFKPFVDLVTTDLAKSRWTLRAFLRPIIIALLTPLTMKQPWSTSIPILAVAWTVFLKHLRYHVWYNFVEFVKYF